MKNHTQRCEWDMVLSPRPGDIEQLALGNDDNALLGDQQPALAVVVGVVTDRGVRRDLDVLVDDRPADAAVAADIHALKQDRVLDHGVTVDTDVWRQDAVPDVTARDDAALADQAIVSLAAAGGSRRAEIAEDEFRRGQLRLIGANRPLAVVQVQYR